MAVPKTHNKPKGLSLSIHMVIEPTKEKKLIVSSQKQKATNLDAKLFTLVNTEILILQ